MTPSKPVVYFISRPNRLRQRTVTSKLLPFRIAFCTSSESSPHGVSSEKSRSSARPWSRRSKYWATPLPACAHGRMTPSRRLTESSAMSRSASTVILVPRPEHSGQAPNGALNEKVRGSISVSCSGWPFGQDSFSEKLRQAASPSSSMKLIATRPSVSRSAVSSESVSRVRMSSAATSRSTMTAMSCLICFLRIGGSLSWICSPSTIAREYPLAASDWNRSTNSPFFCEMTGLTTW